MKFVFAALVLVALARPALAVDVRCLPGIACGNYDVILLVGQSNATSRGISHDAPPRYNNDRIWQIGRRTIDGAIVPASEPLENVTYATYGSGFALAFARQYRETMLAPDRSVLIVPSAKGATGLVGDNAYWKPDGAGFQEASSRLRSVLGTFPNSRLVAILWHQGESDAAMDPAAYKDALKELLTKLRGSEDVPLVVGELADSLIENVPKASAINDVIRAMPNELPRVGLARSAGLATFGATESGTVDYTHFTAESQMELGRRYFCAFERLLPNADDSGTDDYCRTYSFVP